MTDVVYESLTMHVSSGAQPLGNDENVLGFDLRPHRAPIVDLHFDDHPRCPGMKEAKRKGFKSALSTVLEPVRSQASNV